jgi:hypothetical protein
MEMKAFFGALILSIASAAVGVLASAELHEMALAAGGAKAVLRSTPEYSQQEQNQQIKQPVNYPAEGAVPSLSSESGGN